MTGRKDRKAEQGPEYTFGDNEVASRRLADLARLHEADTARFLQTQAPPRPELAIDLGCGPGHTTRLLADTLQPTRTVGIDSSEAFLDEARLGAPELEFVRHDVTDLPLPLPPADVIFARFLLAHLPDPVAIAAGWTSQLVRGGVLLLEETEHMESSNRVCARYLDLVQGTLAAEGTRLFAGAALRDLSEGDGWRVKYSEVSSIEEPARRFASLFAPNLSQFGPAAISNGLATREDLARLAAGLDGLLTGESSDTVMSVRRQVVLVRD